jgi:hypothetical protein
MAVTHLLAVRTAIADLVVDKIDLGSGTAGGVLQLKNAASTVLCSIALPNPAFGAAASGIATANAISNGTVTVAGTISKFTIVDRDGTEVFSGSVTATGGGGDMESDGSSLVVSINDILPITSLTYQAPN